MARCAVPVAERSVRRRNESGPTVASSGSFLLLSQAGTAERAIPARGQCADAPRERQTEGLTLPEPAKNRHPVTLSRTCG